MAAANKGAPPRWLSTHPSGNSRIKDIAAALRQVMVPHERANVPDRTFDPPAPRDASSPATADRICTSR
jgi:hypothetical protein